MRPRVPEGEYKSRRKAHPETRKGERNLRGITTLALGFQNREKKKMKKFAKSGPPAPQPPQLCRALLGAGGSLGLA